MVSDMRDDQLEEQQAEFKSQAEARPKDLIALWKAVESKYFMGVKATAQDLTSEGKAIIFLSLEQVCICLLSVACISFLQTWCLACVAW